MPSTKSTAAQVDEPERLRFVSIADMSADLNVCPHTLKRRAKSDDTFPPLTTYGNRIYANAAAWEAYKHGLMSRGLATRPIPLGKKVAS
jgi:hypothetical protein